MKQTGTFHVYEIKNNQRVVSPIPNAFIYFISEGNITVKTKTDDMGKYDFELPIGEYTVASASEGGIEQILANGSKFILTDQSTEKAFEEWVNAPSADVDEALLKRFKELAKIAEDAAREAGSILAEMTDNSIGDGEWVRKTYVDNEVDKKWDTQATTGSGNIARMSEVNEKADTSYVNTELGKKWDIQETIGAGRVMKESSGISVNSRTINMADSLPNQNGFVINNAEGSDILWKYGYGIEVADSSGEGGRFVIQGTHSGHMFYNPWMKIYSLVKNWTNMNTTIDSNGFIKAASPIISLYANYIEHNNQFDEEPVFEKLGVGYYKISNTPGLAKGLEAGDWYIETPKDKNGERYFNTEWQQLEDSTVIIRTYAREAFTEEYERYDENGNVLKDPNGNPLKFYKRHDINGEPVDITENRFISLRFYEEPKQHEAPEIAEESEEDRKAREEQQALEAREQEIAELKRNRTLKSNEALVMKDIDESVYLELIEEVKEINARLKIVQ